MMNDHELKQLKQELDDALNENGLWSDYYTTTTEDWLSLVSSALSAIEQLEGQRNTARRGEGW